MIGKPRKIGNFSDYIFFIFFRLASLSNWSNENVAIEFELILTMKRVLVTSSNPASFYLPDSPRRSAIPTPIDTTTTACSKRLTLSKLLKLFPSLCNKVFWMWQQFSFAQKATIFHSFAQRLRRARTRSREGNLWGKSLFLCKSSSRKTLKYFLIVSLSAFRSAKRDFFYRKNSRVATLFPFFM